MAAIKTGYACPLCEKSEETNEVIAEGGKLKCSKVPGHIWTDSDSFSELNPKIRFQQAQERPAPQENHTNVNVSISVPLYNDLLAKYGDKLSAALVGALKIIAEGEPMIISKEDLQQIEKVLGEAGFEKPKSARHMAGIIFSMHQQLLEAKEVTRDAVEQAKAYEGMVPGTTVVNLGQYYQHCLSQAKEESMPVKPWLESKLNHAFENNWW